MLVPVLGMRAEVVAGGGAFIADASCLLPIRLSAPVPSPPSRGDRPPPIALGALEPSPRVYRCPDGVSRSGKRTNCLPSPATEERGWDREALWLAGIPAST